MDKAQLEAQFRKLWARSETFFDGFLTRDALLVKPIELRHPFLFYVGHIAGFNYIHVNRKVCKEEPFNADVSKRNPSTEAPLILNRQI